MVIDSTDRARIGVAKVGVMLSIYFHVSYLSNALTIFVLLELGSRV